MSKCNNFIPEKAFDNVVCNMAVILSWPHMRLCKNKITSGSGEGNRIRKDYKRMLTFPLSFVRWCLTLIFLLSLIRYYNSYDNFILDLLPPYSTGPDGSKYHTTFGHSPKVNPHWNIRIYSLPWNKQWCVTESEMHIIWMLFIWYFIIRYYSFIRYLVILPHPQHTTLAEPTQVAAIDGDHDKTDVRV